MDASDPCASSSHPSTSSHSSTMEIQTRQLLVAVFGIVIAIGFANAGRRETAPPVVVGLAKCSDCARRNMNAEAAFRGLQVAIKCKNSKGAYESTAVGQVTKSGTFSVPLAADAVGEDGELKSECFAQLHSASSSAPCPGQEPSRIVAAPPGHEKTFVALGGKVYRPSPECASAFLCHHFFHSLHHHHVGVHAPVVIPHLPVHGHSVPPVTKPPPAVDVPEHKPAPVPAPEHKPPSTPAVDVPEHKPAPVPEPEHKPPSTPANAPPSTPTEPSAPVNSPPKPTPIYHPPAQHDAVTGP